VKHTVTKRPDSRKKLEEVLQDDPFVLARWFGRPEDGDVCEPCIRALEDPDEIVREAAVSALIMLDDMYASMPIVGTLLHGSAHAREAAARVLGAIGRSDPIAFQYLAVALTDSDKAVRLAAVQALKRLADGLDLIAEDIERS
jgi:HEAT repeat protein